MNQDRTTAHAAAVAVAAAHSFWSEAGGNLTGAASATALVTDAGECTALTFMSREDFDFEILSVSEGGGWGVIWTASADRSEHFKTAAAAAAAHLSGKRAEASLSKHLQAR